MDACMSRWVDWAHPVPLRKWMFQLSRSSRSQSAHWNDSALLEQASKALCGEKSLKDQIGTIGTQEGGGDMWCLRGMGDDSGTQK